MSQEHSPLLPMKKPLLEPPQMQLQKQQPAEDQQLKRNSTDLNKLSEDNQLINPSSAVAHSHAVVNTRKSANVGVYKD